MRLENNKILITTVSSIIGLGLIIFLLINYKLNESTNDKIYDSIFETDYYKKQKEIHPKTVDGFKFSYVKKMIEKTNLGKLFYEICVKEL